MFSEKYYKKIKQDIVRNGMVFQVEWFCFSEWEFKYLKKRFCRKGKRICKSPEVEQDANTFLNILQHSADFMFADVFNEFLNITLILSWINLATSEICLDKWDYVTRCFSSYIWIMWCVYMKAYHSNISLTSWVRHCMRIYRIKKV